MIAFELLRVTEVRHVKDHVLWLRFSDGVEGTVDLSRELRGEVFEAVRDPMLFGQATIVDNYTIGWPNGADFAPETLYDRLEVTNGAPKRSQAQLLDDATGSFAVHAARMPEISRFFGIVIRMWWTEHETPHFHAQYAEFAASVEIRGGVVHTTGFPRRALRLVLEWAELHEADLLENWQRMRRDEAPLPIPPLE